MHIKRLKGRNFFNYDSFELEFPESGITLVTGKNGSGKSALSVETASMAIGGQTLRGTPAWRFDEEGWLEVELDNLLICRGKKPKESPTLQWAIDGKDQEYATTTKGQKALENVIRDWDTWKKVSVLAPMIQDIALFTLATDATRKRLIESLIGLDVFDPALEACRKDKKSIEKDKAQILNKISNYEGKLEVSKQSLENISNIEIEDTKDYTAEITSTMEAKAKVKHSLDLCVKEIDQYRKDINAIKLSISEETTGLKYARSKAKIIEQDQCPTCRRPVDDTVIKVFSSELEQEESTRTSKIESYEVELSKLKTELETAIEDKEDIEDSYKELVDKLTDLNNKVYKSKETRKKAAEKEDMLRVARANIEEYETELSSMKKGLEDLNEQLDLLAAAEKVLGLEGPRATMVGKLLSGIESIVNRWLLEIAGPGLQVKLRDYTETGKSGISSKISLDVLGAGGGYGYRAASPGERRRIDIAFMFALADVAASARGISGGDIYADEITDGVDEQGKLATAEALKKMAESRHVIVITHDMEFASMLQYSMHINVHVVGKENSAAVFEIL